MKKTLLLIFLACLIGILLSLLTIFEYKKNKKNINVNNYVYLFQYGAYKSKDNMEESTKELDSYYYYKDNLYHVIVALSSDKTLESKIKESFNISTDLYLKKISIKDKALIEEVKQYDNLVKNTNDKNVIINAEKQILSKYNEVTYERTY